MIYCWKEFHIDEKLGENNPLISNKPPGKNKRGERERERAQNVLLAESVYLIITV